MSHQRKLSDVIPLLEQEIQTRARTVRPIGPRSRVSRKRAYTVLLFENYAAVVIILKRIAVAIRRVGQIQHSLFPPNAAKNLPELETETLVTETLDLLKHLDVDIKSLYLWTALITDIFERSPVKVELLELKRISLFRHKFITHIHDNKPFFERL
jgi:hypothetical protein